MECIQEIRTFGGIQRVFRHASSSTRCDMEFAVFDPAPESFSSRPTLFYLSGLTCTWANVTEKAGVQRYAAEHGIMLVMPDTSPRGLALPGEDDDYDFGSGAGFYINATQAPWSDHYRMFDYVSQELPGIVTTELQGDPDRLGVMGHSMGGGGTIYLGGTFPHIWAGIAPLAPAVFFDSSILNKMPKMPIYIVAGELDLLVPVGSVRRWADQMKALGMDYTYNEIQGGDHNSSFTNNPKMIADIYDFFDKRQRNAKPSLSSHKIMRVFTNRRGIQIKASIDSVTEDKVSIEREDGRKFTLPLTTLSAADRDFLKEWRDSRDKGRD